MSLYLTIKTDALSARKRRDTATATSLTTLIGELETFSKNAGREPTDADVVAFVKKTVKNIDETLSVVGRTDGLVSDAMLAEKELFERYLPKQLSELELKEVIEGFIAAGTTNVGDAMRLLKTQYNGQYDGALASTILKARFAK